MTLLKPGITVLASDGLSPWEPALIVSGPHEQLTTENPLFLIRYAEGDEYLALPSSLRPVPSSEEA